MANPIPVVPLLKFTDKEIKRLRRSWNLNNQLHQPTSIDSPSMSRSGSISSASSSSSSSGSSRNPKLGESTSDIFSSTSFWIDVYQDLLRKDPQLESSLPAIKHQSAQFSSILLTAIESLEDLTSLQIYLLQLGRSHIRVFNVQPLYFQKMGESIFYVLQKKVPDLFTLQLWMRLYNFLANTMTQGGMDVVTFTETSARDNSVTVFLENITTTPPPIISTDEPSNDDNSASSAETLTFDPKVRSQPRSKRKRYSLSSNSLTKYRTLATAVSNEATIVEEESDLVPPMTNNSTLKTKHFRNTNSSNVDALSNRFSESDSIITNAGSTVSGPRDSFDFTPNHKSLPRSTSTTSLKIGNQSSFGRRLLNRFSTSSLVE